MLVFNIFKCYNFRHCWTQQVPKVANRFYFWIWCAIRW